FDLAFSYNFKPKMTLRGGITNVLNTAPVEVASTAGFPIGTPLNQVCNGAPGCQNPTSPSLQTTGAFNGGYYDVQGRRAFLGFNVNLNPPFLAILAAAGQLARRFFCALGRRLLLRA